jgi:hypothetical protein
MTDLLSQIINWRTLVGIVVVFGFAPGAALRIIVRAFERSDPRRRELLGELYAVPRWERPVWVAQQLEVALFEGVAGRMAKSYRRLAPARRTSEWFRREKRNFIYARYTVGYTVAATSYFAVLVYTMVLVPGPAGLAASGVWMLAGVTMAWFHKRATKRLKPGQAHPATRFDIVLIVLAGPFAYGTSAYMFIHNLLALASGHMSAGYWIGTYLCLLFFGNIPKLIREIRRSTKDQREILSAE